MANDPNWLCNIIVDKINSPVNLENHKIEDTPKNLNKRNIIGYTIAHNLIKSN